MDHANAPPPWPPLLAARGNFGRSATHDHHGMHVVLSLSATLSSRVGEESAPVRSAGIITAPDVLHDIDMSDGPVLLVFIDPESAVGLALRAVFSGSCLRIDEQQRAQLTTELSPRAIMDKDGIAWTQQLVASLGASVPERPHQLHPAVRRALSLVRSASAEDEQSLASIAQTVGLSESRLLHAFTESVGIPWRPYLSWLRVQRAVSAIATGASLSEAAHGAGFADAPHMSRTFRRMLGLTPRELQEAIVASPFKTSPEHGR